LEELGAWKVMVERIDERTLHIMDSLDKLTMKVEKINDKNDALAEEINCLKVHQETIQANSNLGDEKIRSMVNVNSIKTASLTSTVILLIQYVYGHLK
jgi:FtsZ-binding cell division protein ZapB